MRINARWTMTSSNRRLIPDSVQNLFIKWLSPLIRLFARLGLSPNAFTVAGVIITGFSAAAFLIGSLRLAGLLLLAGGFCDTIDGLLARTSGKATRFGALLDSTVDRYAEFIMFFGISAYFISCKDYITAAAAFLALCGSFMVSYARARAESLGFEAKMGLMQRPERIVLIGLAALLHTTALIGAIWLVALLANFTALQRIRFAYKQDPAAVEPKTVSER